MKSKNLVITNSLGLHARPSAKLTQMAGRFKSDVWISKAGQKVNAKSIMGVMMLAAAHGEIITLEIIGEDENEALLSLSALVENQFDEIE